MGREVSTNGALHCSSFTASTSVHKQWGSTCTWQRPCCAENGRGISSHHPITSVQMAVPVPQLNFRVCFRTPWRWLIKQCMHVCCPFLSFVHNHVNASIVLLFPCFFFNWCCYLPMSSPSDLSLVLCFAVRCLPIKSALCCWQHAVLMFGLYRSQSHSHLRLCGRVVVLKCCSFDVDIPLGLPSFPYVQLCCLQLSGGLI